MLNKKYTIEKKNISYPNMCNIFKYHHLDGVRVADDVKALVHLVGTAMVGLRVPAAATKKDIGQAPAQKVPQ